jgi:ribosomal protein L32
MEKTQCLKCGEWKSVEDFSKNKRKRGYHNWCKSCVKEYDHARYKENKEKISKQKKDRRKSIKEWFFDYKSFLKCEICGESHIATLDFHHLDKTSKDFNVSNAAKQGFSKRRILEETNKCIILCANCHRKLHYEENNSQ